MGNQQSCNSHILEITWWPRNCYCLHWLATSIQAQLTRQLKGKVQLWSLWRLENVNLSSAAWRMVIANTSVGAKMVTPPKATPSVLITKGRTVSALASAVELKDVAQCIHGHFKQFTLARIRATSQIESYLEYIKY